MDIARIMSEFNVSFDMALNRLESLGVIDTDQKTRLDNAKIEMKVGNLLRGVGGNSRLNVASEVIDIPYEYIDYVIYNYNHNAVPKDTLERVLACYALWNSVIKRLGTVGSSNYIYLNPLFTLIAATLLLGERLTPVAIAGCLITLIGVWTASRSS